MWRKMTEQPGMTRQMFPCLQNKKKNKSSTIEVGTKVRSSLWHTADTSPDTLNTKDNTKQVMNIELAHILGWHQSRGSGKKKHFIYFFNVINTRAPAAAIYKKNRYLHIHSK